MQRIDGYKMRICKFTRLILSISLLLSFLNSSPALSRKEKPRERINSILRHIDDLWRGDSSYAVFKVQVKTAHYTRTMKMKGWSKGKDKSLVRITAPLKEKGTATLRSGNNIYTYLPRTDRTIRLTSGMMMGSWMGSHFTNDDLVKESRLEDDYYADISFEGIRNNRNIIEITLTPKPYAAVVWGKVALTLLADGYIQLTEIFYDEDMTISRTFTFTWLKQIAGALRPTVMRVIPADRPEEFTELVYEELKFNIKIKDGFFSISNLKRR